MKNVLQSIISSIIILIIGGFIGILFNKYQSEGASSPKYLDFYQNVNNDIFNQLDVDKRTDIQINNKKIGNLCLLNIKLYNFSDKDLENLPLRIEIKINSKKIISSNYYGFDGSKELVKEDTSKLNTDNLLFKKYYFINLASRKGLTPVFSADFLIDGNISTDDIKLYIDKAGVDKRDFNYNNFIKKSFWETDLFFILTFIIGCIIIAIIIIRLSNIGQKKYEMKLGKYIADTLKNKYQTDNITFSINDFVDTYIKLRNNYYWKNSSRFSRFIEGLKKPEEI